VPCCAEAGVLCACVLALWVRRKAQEREEVERTLTRKMSEVQERHVSWADTVKAVRVHVSALPCAAMRKLTPASFVGLRPRSASVTRVGVPMHCVMGASGTRRHTDRFRVYVPVCV
jgi:hypothetical protein